MNKPEHSGSLASNIAARRFHFSAGHRVFNHESCCANLHGHNYVLWVHAQSKSLDSLGRVIDFSVLKERIDPWLQSNWDHNFLFFNKDSELSELKKHAPGNKPWFACPFNPTAENMARYLFDEICPALLSGTDVQVTKIELWETENCRVIITA